jgi:DNA polymerase-3 subunit epsilon
VFGLKKIFSRGNSAAADLPADLQQALADWRNLPTPNLADAHYHTRYVVIDLTTSGFKPNEDDLLGITAIGLTQGGCILPNDVVSLDFSGMENESVTVDRQLMAFLQFTAKAPLVSYHWPFVGAFLQRAFKERLGLDFQPDCIDLAWLLPSLFDDKAQSLQPLDHWLEAFGMAAEGRRDSMANALVLARLMQRLLVRATNKEIDTAAKLVEESKASSLLRRTH